MGKTHYTWDKRSDLVLWEDLEGAGGKGGGRGDRDGEDMWTQGLFISMYDKIHYKKKKSLYSYKNVFIEKFSKVKLLELYIKKKKSSIS